MAKPTVPLSDEQLAEIRAELERTTHPDWRPHTTVGQLLAEVDRLRAALAEREALAAEYGARIVAASMAAAPRETPEVGR